MKFIKKLKDKIYSGDNIVSLSDMRYLPRWIILSIDLLLIFTAALISFYIATRFNRNSKVFFDNFQVIALILVVNTFFMYVFKTYAGVIRHSTFIDLFKLLLSTFCSVFLIGLINSFIFYKTGIRLITPTFAFLSLLGALSCLLLFVFRLTVKEFFHYTKEFRRSSLKKRILVLGIDDQSIVVARAIQDNANLPYSLEGFLTDRHDSSKANILGKKIYTKDIFKNDPKEILGIDGVIIVKETLSKEEMNNWVNLFLENGLQILKSPSVQKVRNNDLNGSIKNLQIEDLLNRKPIKIDNEEVRKRHFNRNILVTGGAGSIGREIVKQVAKFNPEVIVVLDQAETPLYEIELEMKRKFPEATAHFILGDITNYERLESLFQKYSFSVVYHAAAYKHVPLVEENPNEGVLVNIAGTKNLALLASKYQVNRFVMISTDKAVNPTNVMGATKRAAELFVQALQNEINNKTKFITTRFGNVLGSNGSVIPHFKKQIEEGGPVTITHPEIVRYFMTITEACELVLQAGAMGMGGEIYVFDMGEPVKIKDLALRMIKLSGYEPNVDIKVIYTGLRPGEKLYEELLGDHSKTLPTHNEKILISRDLPMEFKDIDEFVTIITYAAMQKDQLEVVKMLKKIVPEFKSNNSVFQMLD